MAKNFNRNKKDELESKKRQLEIADAIEKQGKGFKDLIEAQKQLLKNAYFFYLTFEQ